MMKLYKERLLSDAQLKRLGEHQYSCQSVSILDKLLQPYWNWLTSKVPIWLAPNLITILGLIVNIVTALILVWYSPDAKQEAPRWACGLCSLGLFVYQSLDAIDGKQARRTGTANPLGELFDHGCDSISTVFVALSACVAVQLGYYPGWMFFQCFCAMTLFYCAHWQTYVSGTLRFGKIDVTEAQYTIMGILLLSTIFGPSIWSTKFFSGSVYLWYLIPLSTLMCGLWSLYQSLIVIFTGGVGKNGSTVAVFGLSFAWCHVICSVFYMGYFQVFYTLLESVKMGGCGKNGSTVAALGFGGGFVSNEYTGRACERRSTRTRWCFDRGDQRALGSAFIAVQLFYCKCISVLSIFTKLCNSWSKIPGLDMEVKLIPIGMACAVALLLAQANVSIIFTGGVGKNGSTVAGTSVLSPVIPFSMVLVPAFIIYQKSTEHVYEEHPALYILAFGLVAAKVTNRLVVAHMTKSEMDYMDWSLLGPAMLFLNQYFNTFIKEYYILWLCMLWVAIDLLRYCYQICTEICDYLRVQLFRIPYPGGPHRVISPMLNLPSEKNGKSEKKIHLSDGEDVVPLLQSEEHS